MCAGIGTLEVASVVVAVKAETMLVWKVAIKMKLLRRTLAAENVIALVFILFARPDVYFGRQARAHTGRLGR
jgi:hypothetical protein